MFGSSNGVSTFIIVEWDVVWDGCWSLGVVGMLVGIVDQSICWGIIVRFALAVVVLIAALVVRELMWVMW